MELLVQRVMAGEEGVERAGGVGWVEKRPKGGRGLSYI